MKSNARPIQGTGDLILGTHPERIEAFSPVLTRSGYAGWLNRMNYNPERVGANVDNPDSTPLG